MNLTEQQIAEKEIRPILMRAPMVRATLEDRKTQTRRVVKGTFHPDTVRVDLVTATDGVIAVPRDKFGRSLGERIKCPYGKVGDLLYVKEDFWCVYPREGILFDLKYSDDQVIAPPGDLAASWETQNQARCFSDKKSKRAWVTFRKHQARFMPRWASRLILEITAIRIERVQDMRFQDIEAEGAHEEACDINVALQAFINLWNSINPKFPFESNPYVWALEFKKAMEPK